MSIYKKANKLKKRLRKLKRLNDADERRGQPRALSKPFSDRRVNRKRNKRRRVAKNRVKYLPKGTRNVEQTRTEVHQETPRRKAAA
jgi:hypothetical protein